MFSKEKAEVQAKYGKQWASLDEAHRVEHFDNVFNAGIKIAQRAGLDIDPREIFVVAYFHDLFTWSRSNHHFLAETFIRTTTCPIVTEMLQTPGAVNRVALACREHRASWTGKYSSDLSKVMASADRGIPKTAQELLQRSMVYTAAHNPNMSDAEIKQTAVLHIKDKFGRNGYSRVPQEHLEMFQPEYEILYTEIDDL